MSMFDLPVDPDYDYPIASELPYDPIQYAMQSMWMGDQPMPSYYGTGPMPGAYAPTLDPITQYMLATGAQAPMDKYGNPEVMDLTNQNAMMNFIQNAYSSLADSMNAYMAGPGSYAPGVLDPITEETPLDLVQTPLLQQLAGTGGAQGTLAQFMLPPQMGGFGDNYMTAVNRLRRGLNNPEQLGLSEAEVTQLREELPARMDQVTGSVLDTSDPNNIDWNAVAKNAQDMWTPFAQEQAQVSAPGVIQRDGRFFTTEQKDSPQMEWLRKLGLPDPRAQYDLQFALENDPAVAGAFATAGSTAAVRDAQRKTFEEYTKRLSKQREQESTMKAEDKRKMDQYTEATRRAMDDYFKAMTNPRMQEPEFQTTQERPGERPLEAAMRTLRENEARSEYQRGVRESKVTPEKPNLSLYSRGENLNDEDIANFVNQQRGILSRLPAVGGSLSRKLPQMARRSEREQRYGMLQDANKAAAQSNIDFFRAAIPYAALQASGRSPRTDAIQQRLLPLYTSGAFGQQGLPTAYPRMPRFQP